MSFVEWTFLFGGLAVAGPVIAHLLARPRFRRLPFTMLRFLHTGQVESQSRRKLRDLLILLLRCAIVVLIAMLFARPLLHVRSDPGQTGSVFFLGFDNSMSMAYSDSDGSYFGKMANSAVDFIRTAKAEPAAPAFNICALASGDWARNLTAEQALAHIKATRVEQDSADVGEFLSGVGQASRAQHSGAEISVAVFSDFTPNVLRQLISVEEPVAVAEIEHRQISSSRPIDNAAIVDAHVAGFADGILSIDVAVANYGQVGQNRRLTADSGTGRSPDVETSLPANQRRIYQVQIDLGAAGQEQQFLPVELSLSGNDGLKQDDTFYLGVSVPGHKDTNVLLVGDIAHEMFLVKTAMDTLSRMNPYNTLNVRGVLAGDLVQSDFSWADVVFCSTIAEKLSYLSSSIQTFVNSGGRLICFVTETIAEEAAGQLWQRGVLAGLPGKCVDGPMYPESKPRDSRTPGVDNAAAKSLTNYRMDRILLKGYLECTGHADSRCLWQLQNGCGFIYLKRQGRGTSILVNTSVDDSLGLLTKSNASVAFCQYLLGDSGRVSEHSFVRNERVTLPIPESRASSEDRRQLWVETCDGKKRRAATTNSLVLVPDAMGIGWVKTVGKPAAYAGVNLPQGETDMTRPAAGELAGVMSRVFPVDVDGEMAQAGTFDRTDRRA
ncbi:MAG: BatA domain-containing protein, partial [Planctomycetota bacterium]